MEMIGKGGRAIGRSSDGDSEKGPLNIERKKASGQRESVRDTQATTWNSLKRGPGQYVNHMKKKKNWKYISTSQHTENKFHMDQNLYEKTKL